MRLKLWTSPGLLVLVLLFMASQAAGSPYQQKGFSLWIENGPVTCGTRPLFDGTKISHTDSLSRSTKIVGGYDAERGSNPWQAFLSIKKVNETKICGGTILNEYWILTAAHCYDDVISPLIVAGDHDQRRIELNDQKFLVEKFIQHEGYKNGQHRNDIALIKIRPENGRGIQFNDYVQPACLPDADTVYNTGQQYTISGWGRIDNVTHPRILQEARVSLSPNKVCEQKKEYDSQSMICVNGSIFSCRGDSGGPLVANNKGFYEVLGVTSWGTNDDCKIPRTAYYIKVVRFLDWILSTIRKYGENEAEKTLPPRPRFLR